MSSGELNFKGILLIFNGIILIFLAFLIFNSQYLLYLLCFILFGLVLIKLGYDFINKAAVEKLTADKLTPVIANKDEYSFNNPITNVDNNLEKTKWDQYLQALKYAMEKGDINRVKAYLPYDSEFREITYQKIFNEEWYTNYLILIKDKKYGLLRAGNYESNNDFNKFNVVILPKYINPIKIIPTTFSHLSIFIVEVDNKYGLLYRGNILIEPKYSELICDEFYIGSWFMRITADGLQGLVYKDAILLKPNYKSIQFRDPFISDSNIYFFFADNKYGIFSLFGWLLEPVYSHERDITYEKMIKGLTSYFYLLNADSKKGLICNGYIVLPAEYNSISISRLDGFSNMGHFQASYYLIEVDNKYGVIYETDMSAGVLFSIEPIYDSIEYIGDWKVKVKIGSNENIIEIIESKDSDPIKLKIGGLEIEDFTISGNYIDDIKRCRTLKERSMVLHELFIHYQATCKDTASFKDLYFMFINEYPWEKNADFFYLDRLSLKAMDILVERIYINREKDFSLDDNIKSVFSTCFYYFINNFEQDWTDTTRYCRNDVKSYIYNIPELRSIYEKDLQNINIEKGVPGAIGPVAGGLLDEKKIKNTYGELDFRCHINGNYIDDINISKDKEGRSSILIKIFLHYQKMQMDTNSFKELFFAVFDEIEKSFYDILSIYALDFLIGKLYVEKENGFTLDDNIKSVLSTCLYYYVNNPTQDLGDRTKYCTNDIEFFINSVPELQTLYTEVLKKIFEGFTFSDNYIDDIERSKTEEWRSIILIDLFVHHQKKCKDTIFYKELFFNVFNEMDKSLYDNLAIETLDLLIGRMYIKKEKGFAMDDNTRSVLSTCLYYYVNNFTQDWGDRTRYCKNDIDFFINSIPELQSLREEALKKK